MDIQRLVAQGGGPCGDAHSGSRSGESSEPGAAIANFNCGVFGNGVQQSTIEQQAEAREEDTGARRKAAPALEKQGASHAPPSQADPRTPSTGTQAKPQQAAAQQQQAAPHVQQSAYYMQHGRSPQQQPQIHPQQHPQQQHFNPQQQQHLNQYQAQQPYPQQIAFSQQMAGMSRRQSAPTPMGFYSPQHTSAGPMLSPTQHPQQHQHAGMPMHEQMGMLSLGTCIYVCLFIEFWNTSTVKHHLSPLRFEVFC